MTVMSATTRLSFDCFKARMDAALKASFAARALTAVWRGHTLELSGPGCRASATFDNGHFHGFLELGGPALLMRRVIFADLNRMLCAAGCMNIRLGESQWHRAA